MPPEQFDNEVNEKSSASNRIMTTSSYSQPIDEMSGKPYHDRRGVQKQLRKQGADNGGQGKIKNHGLHFSHGALAAHGLIGDVRRRGIDDQRESDRGDAVDNSR